MEVNSRSPGMSLVSGFESDASLLPPTAQMQVGATFESAPVAAPDGGLSEGFVEIIPSSDGEDGPIIFVKTNTLARQKEREERKNQKVIAAAKAAQRKVIRIGDGFDTRKRKMAAKSTSIREFFSSPRNFPVVEDITPPVKKPRQSKKAVAASKGKPLAGDSIRDHQLQNDQFEGDCPCDNPLQVVGSPMLTLGELGVQLPIVGTSNSPIVIPLERSNPAVKLITPDALKYKQQSKDKLKPVFGGGRCVIARGNEKVVGAQEKELNSYVEPDLNSSSQPSSTPCSSYYPTEEDIQLVASESDDGDEVKVLVGGSAPSSERPNYDASRRYHIEWTAHCPWAIPIMESGRHYIKCEPCSVIDGRVVLLAAKLDTLLKHEGQRKAMEDDSKLGLKKGDVFVTKTCRHQQNMLLYVKRPQQTVLEQVNHVDKSMRKKKRVQMVTLFHIFAHGRPMIDYPRMEDLYDQLGTPNMPRKHWTETSGWCLVDAMYSQVKDSMREKIQSARYVALSCDEVTTVDHGSYISVHAYVCENWVRVPLLLTIQQVVDGAKAGDLTKVLMDVLIDVGGLDSVTVRSKLISFGADGANVFQGCKTGVAKQITDRHAPFCIGNHDFAHKLNLAFKSLSGIGVMPKIEDLLSASYTYFAHSPLKIFEFQKLAEETETKGLKLLRNVSTRWISLLDPLRRVLSQYRGVMAKMVQDRDTEEKAKTILDLMADPYTLLGMAAIEPMIEAVDILMQFAQARNVYICDFVGALLVCEGQLLKLFVDPTSAFTTYAHHILKSLLECTHYDIHLKWDLGDMNEGVDKPHLVFNVNGTLVPAIVDGKRVDKATFYAIAARVKVDCAAAAAQLIKEMRSRFPAHNVMNSLGVVFPQYWHGENAKTAMVSFAAHLEVIKKHFATSKDVGEKDNKVVVPGLLSGVDLECEQSLFKLCMESNCGEAMTPNRNGDFDENPLTTLWRTLAANPILCARFPQYMRLAEIAITMVMGSVEDERTFSSLKFLKSHLRNSLLKNHLRVAVGMHAQKIFTINNFPYDATFSEWYNTLDRTRYGASA